MSDGEPGWKRWLVAGALLAAATWPARADRPFIATTSAAAEEDDDRVWAVGAWAWRDPRYSELGVEAEYAFEPRQSTRFGLVRSRPRGAGAGAGVESALQFEAEFKWLYNHIARDGWGLGLNVSGEARREGDAAWRGNGWVITVPFSWRWGEGGGVLHLNAGWAGERGEPRRMPVSAAAEVPLSSRWVLFAEAFKSGGDRLGQVGLRWWLRRERLLVDFAAVQRRPDAAPSSTGWLLAVGLVDL